LAQANASGTVAASAVVTLRYPGQALGGTLMSGCSCPGSTAPMAKMDWRNRLKRMPGPLIWLAGLALIIYCSPADYRLLPLGVDEQVAAFRGQSHELVTVGGASRDSFRRGRVLRTANGLLRHKI